MHCPKRIQALRTKLEKAQKQDQETKAAVENLPTTATHEEWTAACEAFTKARAKVRKLQTELSFYQTV